MQYIAFFSFPVFWTLFLIVTLPLHSETAREKLQKGDIGDSIVWQLKDETICLTLLQKEPLLITECKENLETNKRESKTYHITADSKGRLGILFNLPLTRVLPQNRKRAGPAPRPGELDLRPIWNPKVIVDDKLFSLECAAYTVTWPQDGTEIAGKKLTLYYAPPPALVGFPYWIEIPTTPAPTYVRTVNSTKKQALTDTSTNSDSVN